MKILIYLASTSRRAIPRVGNFVFSEEYQKYLYLGRPLTPDEANEAAAQILDKPIRNLGHTITFRVIEEAAAPKKAAVIPPKATEPDEPTPIAKYTLEDDSVFLDGVKVAIITNGNIRMAKNYTQLREEVETFINSIK